MYSERVPQSTRRVPQKEKRKTSDDRRQIRNWFINWNCTIIVLWLVTFTTIYMVFCFCSLSFLCWFETERQKDAKGTTCYFVWWLEKMAGWLVDGTNGPTQWSENIYIAHSELGRLTRDRGEVHCCTFNEPDCVFVVNRCQFEPQKTDISWKFPYIGNTGIGYAHLLHLLKAPWKAYYI